MALQLHDIIPEGLVPHPLWFLFIWLKCLVPCAAYFINSTEAMWISSHKVQEELLVRLHFGLTQWSECTTVRHRASACICVYLHVHLFECLFVCVLGLCMFMCACGYVHMFLLVPAPICDICWIHIGLGPTYTAMGFLMKVSIMILQNASNTMKKGKTLCKGCAWNQRATCTENAWDNMHVSACNIRMNIITCRNI